MQSVLCNGEVLIFLTQRFIFPSSCYVVFGGGGKYARIDHVNVPDANRFQMIYIGVPTAALSGSTRQAPTASCLLLIHC